MAKQVGPFKLRGCYDNLCFYKMDGEYYVRTKSSLSGKRVKKDAAFKKTMQNAHWLGQAAAIASKVYRALPKEKKEAGLYKKLTGQVMRMLKDGKSEKEILEGWQPKKAANERVRQAAKTNNTLDKISIADEVLLQVFGETVCEGEIICCTAEAPP